jgi:hypothetical protein
MDTVVVGAVVGVGMRECGPGGWMLAIPRRGDVKSKNLNDGQIYMGLACEVRVCLVSQAIGNLRPRSRA